ncbi:hypothetical protein Tco_0771688 [Tanacetum coccineum]|uniref:Uncharacterized protein n=1 Tax=Tanacetum coccineum TaxID=301880 RepID=A0ABQ4ZJC3_9ASTR
MKCMDFLLGSGLNKKRKQVAGETISLRKSLKVTIKQKKQSTTPIPPPSDDRERDEIGEATLLSLTLHKTAISYVSEFADSMLNDDDDSGTRIDPGSHKEHPKTIDDNDETEKEKKDDETNDEKANEDEKKDETCSMKTRKEKMQTPIPSPLDPLGKTYLRIMLETHKLRSGGLGSTKMEIARFRERESRGRNLRCKIIWKSEDTKSSTPLWKP